MVGTAVASTNQGQAVLEALRGPVQGILQPGFESIVAEDDLFN
jgi:hypothetical protein